MRSPPRTSIRVDSRGMDSRSFSRHLPGRHRLRGRLTRVHRDRTGPRGQHVYGRLMVGATGMGATLVAIVLAAIALRRPAQNAATTRQPPADRRHKLTRKPSVQSPGPAGAFSFAATATLPSRQVLTVCPRPAPLTPTTFGGGCSRQRRRRRDAVRRGGGMGPWTRASHAALLAVLTGG
jgi:hypothetical protein